MPVQRVRKTYLFILLGLLLSSLAIAQDDSESEDSDEEQSGPKPYAEVITDEAESDEGLFTVHSVDDKYYFEIPESLYGEDMLLVTRIGGVPAGLDGFIVSGTKVAEQVLRWERRGTGSRLASRRSVTPCTRQRGS